MAARHEEGRYKKIVSTRFIVCKGLSNDDVGVAWGTVIQEVRPGAGFKTGYFVKKKGVGGASVERLHRSICVLAPLLFNMFFTTNQRYGRRGMLLLIWGFVQTATRGHSRGE